MTVDEKEWKDISPFLTIFGLDSTKIVSSLKAIIEKDKAKPHVATANFWNGLFDLCYNPLTIAFTNLCNDNAKDALENYLVICEFVIRLSRMSSELLSKQLDNLVKSPSSTSAKNGAPATSPTISLTEMAANQAERDALKTQVEELQKQLEAIQKSHDALAKSKIIVAPDLAKVNDLNKQLNAAKHKNSEINSRLRAFNNEWDSYKKTFMKAKPFETFVWTIPCLQNVVTLTCPAKSIKDSILYGRSHASHSGQSASLTAPKKLRTLELSSTTTQTAIKLIEFFESCELCAGSNGKTMPSDAPACAEPELKTYMSTLKGKNRKILEMPALCCSISTTMCKYLGEISSCPKGREFILKYLGNAMLNEFGDGGFDLAKCICIKFGKSLLSLLVFDPEFVHQFVEKIRHSIELFGAFKQSLIGLDISANFEVVNDLINLDLDETVLRSILSVYATSLARFANLDAKTLAALVADRPKAGADAELEKEVQSLSHELDNVISFCYKAPFPSFLILSGSLQQIIETSILHPILLIWIRSVFIPPQAKAVIADIYSQLVLRNVSRSSAIAHAYADAFLLIREHIDITPIYNAFDGSIKLFKADFTDSDGLGVEYLCKIAVVCDPFKVPRGQDSILHRHFDVLPLAREFYHLLSSPQLDICENNNKLLYSVVVSNASAMFFNLLDNSKFANLVHVIMTYPITYVKHFVEGISATKLPIRADKTSNITLLSFHYGVGTPLVRYIYDTFCNRTGTPPFARFASFKQIATSEAMKKSFYEPTPVYQLVVSPSFCFDNLSAAARLEVASFVLLRPSVIDPQQFPCLVSSGLIHLPNYRPSATISLSTSPLVPFLTLPIYVQISCIHDVLFKVKNAELRTLVASPQGFKSFVSFLRACRGNITPEFMPLCKDLFLELFADSALLRAVYEGSKLFLADDDTFSVSVADTTTESPPIRFKDLCALFQDLNSEAYLCVLMNGFRIGGRSDADDKEFLDAKTKVIFDLSISFIVREDNVKSGLSLEMASFMASFLSPRPSDKGIGEVALANKCLVLIDVVFKIYGRVLGLNFKEFVAFVDGSDTTGVVIDDSTTQRLKSLLKVFEAFLVCLVPFNSVAAFSTSERFLKIHKVPMILQIYRALLEASTSRSSSY